MIRREDNVARLMAEALAGQAARSAILRRAAALGVGDPLVGALLAAQGRTSRSSALPAIPVVLAAPAARPTLAETGRLRGGTLAGAEPVAPFTVPEDCGPAASAEIG